MIWRRIEISRALNLIRRIFLCAVLADLIYLVCFSLLIFYQSEPQLESAPYDAAIVFFQGYDLQNRPLPSYREATDLALQFYREGVVKNIMLVGGNRPSREVFGSKGTAQILSAKEDIPADRVFYDTQSFDTQSNWGEVETRAQEEGWNSLLLIPTPYHIPRLKLLTAHSSLRKHYAATPPDFSPFHREIWFWSHYELVAIVAHVMLPNSIYYSLLRWLRGQSD